MAGEASRRRRTASVAGGIPDVIVAEEHQDVAAAVETVRTSGSATPPVRLAFELRVLTAPRSAEVRLATGERDGRGGPGVDDIGGSV